jgi:hypothetical protein
MLQPAKPVTLLSHGMPFLYRLLNSRKDPTMVRQHICVLLKMFEKIPAFRARAARYFCLLGDFHQAQDLLMNTPSDDPFFIANIIKIVLIGSPENKAVELGTAQFLGRGFADEGIDLLLMTNNWVDATSNLTGMGKLGEAAFICRAQRPSEQRTELMTSLAKRMVIKGMAAYAMILLAEVGRMDEISKQFICELEREQGLFLLRVADAP